MKITVVGLGYVGLSLAVLLAQKHKVIAFDIDQIKIDQINSKISPISDPGIIEFFSKSKLNLIGISDIGSAYNESDYVIISAPTNYDNNSKSFDTSVVEKIISEIIDVNKDCYIVIKSTVPVGFTEKMKKIYNSSRIFFSPEFLREGHALYDNLYPSRIVVGGKSNKADEFAKILAECSKKSDIKIHLMSSNEAEAVKLFSNTYLAMRISFFNELDTFAESYDISSKEIIEAVCDDNRIGNYYNNPSFGYGGYCLPKDAKQLLTNYSNIPSDLIKSVIDSNQTRKSYIASNILKSNPKSVGIYKLVMKTDSDNYRESAVLDLINILEKENIPINLYEPLLKKSISKNVNLINNLSNFISASDLIVANRISKEIMYVSHKVYTRDIFQEN